MKSVKSIAAVSSLVAIPIVFAVGVMVIANKHSIGDTEVEVETLCIRVDRIERLVETLDRVAPEDVEKKVSVLGAEINAKLDRLLQERETP